MTWNCQPHVIEGWRSECLRAVESDEVFASFRRLDNVTYMTENFHADHALPLWLRAVSITAQVSLKLAELVAADAVGSPFPSDVGLVDGLPLSGCAANSALRAAQIRRLFGDEPLHIAEIGGGYGSLANTLRIVGALASYTGFDLPHAAALQRKFLRRQGWEGDWPSLGGPGRAGYDLVISCASLCELGPAAMESYRPLLRSGRCGFHVWNWNREGAPGERNVEAVQRWFTDAVGVPAVHCPALPWVRSPAAWDSVFAWGVP